MTTTRTLRVFVEVKGGTSALLWRSVACEETVLSLYLPGISLHAVEGGPDRVNSPVKAGGVAST